MELKLEEGTYLDFTTHRFDTGAVTDADSTPTAEVFEDGTDAPVESPTVTKRTGKTGNYRVPVTAAAASGYEAGKTYNVVVSATVNSVTGKGVIGRFKVRARTVDDVLPTASYTAPPSAATVASQVRTELGTELGRIDVATSTRSSHTAADVWASATRTLTAISDSAGVTTLLARLSAARAGYLDNLSAGAVALEASVQSVITTLGGLVASIWSYGTRTLSAFSFTPSLDPAYDKAKTAAQAGDAMTLTAGERTAIANEVEAQIIDETDSEKVLTAITNKIAAVNPDLSGLTLSAIAAQVRTELATELARIDVATSTRLAAASYSAAPSAAATATAVRTELTTELARLDAAISTRLASGSYTAPDNATISSIAALVASTALESSVQAIIALLGTPAGASLAADLAQKLNASAYTAPDNASVTAIKAKTDKLTFDTGNRVEANPTAINGAPLTGDGTTASPWGAA